MDTFLLSPGRPSFLLVNSVFFRPTEPQRRTSFFLRHILWESFVKVHIGKAQLFSPVWFTLQEIGALDLIGLTSAYHKLRHKHLKEIAEEKF